MTSGATYCGVPQTVDIAPAADRLASPKSAILTCSHMHDGKNEVARRTRHCRRARLGFRLLQHPVFAGLWSHPGLWD
jgi:hypothetical protein